MVSTYVGDIIEMMTFTIEVVRSIKAQIIKDVVMC